MDVILRPLLIVVLVALALLALLYLTQRGMIYFPSAAAPIIDGLLMDRYPLVEQIGNVQAPLLVIVTETDEIVPARLSRRVIEAELEPTREVAVSGAHHDPALLAGDELVAEVVGFLGEWVAGR